MPRSVRYLVTFAIAAALLNGCSDSRPTSPDDEFSQGTIASSIDKTAIVQEVRSGTLSGDRGRQADPIRFAKVTAGNPYYTVHVDEYTGRYTVTTGPQHPVTISQGSPQNVLYGDGSPATSYNTIRSYTTQTEYSQALPAASSGFTLAFFPALGPVVSTVPLGTGYLTTYDLSRSFVAADDLLIEQILQVNGSTFDDSVVELTTRVTNTGAETVRIGIRYLWDFQIGPDDGPIMVPQAPDSAPRLAEETWSPPDFGLYYMEDNDPSTTAPLFNVFGTVTLPAGITPAPTGADRVSFVSWPDAYDTAFEYADTGQGITEPGTLNDSAVLIYDGSDEAGGIDIAPGATWAFSHSLVSALPGEPPPPYEDPGDDGPQEIVIDIKPGSDPNSIHLGAGGNGKGKADQAGARIAVAIFSSEDFDAAAIDLESVTLGDLTDPGTGIAVKKNGRFQASLTDVDGDGLVDYVMHFMRADLIANGDLVSDSVELFLTGTLDDGTEFEGSDSVNIVP